MQASSPIHRIALYVRVSSEEQREGQTIDSQIAELERFARERGWVIADIYKDDGWSGGMLARPELDRLRDDASKARFSGVLVNDVDRLARDVAHLGVIKRDLERKGIQVIFRKLPAENSPMRNLMVNILGSFAEFEKELIADRTRRGRRHKVEVRQRFIGCIPPYGYQYVRTGSKEGEDGILRVNPEEAVIVRRMFQWVDEEGFSARRVISRLNQTSILPRKGASRWAKSSVLRILRSQVYAGTWHYNKHESYEPERSSRNHKYRRSLKSSTRRRPRADWLPVTLPEALRLVPHDRWERVQDRLTQNISFSPRNSKHAYLLRSLVRCAGCGARFVGEPCHLKFYYRCLTRCKKVGTVQEGDLDNTVWGAVEKALLNPDLVIENIAKLQEQNNGRSEEVAAQAAEIEKTMEQLQMEESRILEAYRQEIITGAQLGREIQKLEARRASAQALQNQLPKEVPRPLLPKARIMELVAEFCAQIGSRLASIQPEEKQQVLRYLVREIIFDGSTARIRAIIPPGGIATTTPYLRGRNPDQQENEEISKNERNKCYQPQESLHPSRSQDGGLAFELIEEVHRNVEARAAASRANLVKANAALQKSRESAPRNDRAGEVEIR